jgi:Zn-dependent protease with chaperone function
MPAQPNISLEVGLKALKQGDYKTAISYLEPLALTEGDTGKGLQAQIGLVKAYARTDKLSRAIALCYSLRLSNNSQVKQWADKTLPQLKKRKSDESASDKDVKDVTGFVLFDKDKGGKQIEDRDRHPSSAIVPISKEDTVEKVNKELNKDEDNNLSSAIVPLRKSITPSQEFKPRQIIWQNTPRAKAWQSLTQVNLIPLWLLTGGTFFALFYLLRELVKFITGLINVTLDKLPFLEPIQLLYADPTGLLFVLLVAITAACPWLLDKLLPEFYPQKSLTKEDLSEYSEESVRLLQRYCQQRGWKFPKLYILTASAPLAFAYGYSPKYGRIVVSSGLLEQLTEEEIATIYGVQLGHIAHWNSPIMSLALLVTVPFYKLYQLLSNFGDRALKPFSRTIFTIFSSLIYLLWCFLTGTTLWLSQLRLYYSDRLACEISGNPNALTRALLKIAIGIADDIAKQEQIGWQIESLNLVLPVGYKQAITIGSAAGYGKFEDLLQWEYLNPYRWWLVVNNSHPLMGDRLLRLNKIASLWHVEPELNFATQHQPKVKEQSFLLQMAPFIGIPIGLAFAFLIRLGWYLAYQLKILNLKWIYDDTTYITGCFFIGFSIGILIRINSFFPEIKNSRIENHSNLVDLYSNSTNLPIDNKGVRLVGKLLGRRGLSNSLGQDLILLSHEGMVRLHHTSWLGQPVNPQDVIGRQVSVTGWFRRGATPWLDIQTLQTQTGKLIHSSHPVWSIILAVTAEAWGAYILLKG